MPFLGDDADARMDEPMYRIREDDRGWPLLWTVRAGVPFGRKPYKFLNPQHAVERHGLVPGEQLAVRARLQNLQKATSWKDIDDLKDMVGRGLSKLANSNQFNSSWNVNGEYGTCGFNCNWGSADGSWGEFTSRKVHIVANFIEEEPCFYVYQLVTAFPV